MKPSPSDSRRLEQVLQDLEDGTLTEDDHGWLMSQLRQRPEIRGAYRKHMAFAAALHDMASAWIPEHEDEHQSVIRPSRWRSISRKPWFAAAAVVTLLAVASAVFVFTRRTPVASVTAGAEASWEYASGGIGRDGEFQAGTRLQVDHGSVEVVTRQRTRVVVEGPAQLSMDAPEKVGLSSGSAWFEASTGDETLTVTSERLQAVSKGARFGVAITSGGHRIQVKAGELRVTPAFSRTSSVTLGPGDAGTLDDSGHWIPDSVEPDLFLDQLLHEVAYIHWSFDEESAGAFPATSHGMKSAPITMAGVNRQAVVPHLVTGAFGRGLDLTSGDAFGESDFAGISGGVPRSVALWVKGAPIVRRATPDGVEYTPSVVQWGDESRDGESWTFRAHCVGGIIGTQWGRNGLLTAGRIGTMSVLDGQWHHIASVFTGNHNSKGEAEVRHYIDGQLVPTTTAILSDRIDTRVGTRPSTRMRVACDPRMPGENVPVMVDELFIVRGALTDAQVKTLWKENKLIPSK